MKHLVTHKNASFKKKKSIYFNAHVHLYSVTMFTRLKDLKTYFLFFRHVASLIKFLRVTLTTSFIFILLLTSF